MSLIGAYVTWHIETYGIDPIKIQEYPLHLPHIEEYYAFKKKHQEEQEQVKNMEEKVEC